MGLDVNPTLIWTVGFDFVLRFDASTWQFGSLTATEPYRFDDEGLERESGGIRRGVTLRALEHVWRVN